MPTFLEQTKYRNPLGSPHGPFQFAFSTNSGIFEFLNERPERLSAFNTFLEGHRANRTPWFQYYPVSNFVDDDMQDENAVLIVDVGGGRGHELLAFKKAFPDQRGRLIVQDLSQTIDDIDHLTRGVESMKYDFFTPQPIKGLITSTSFRDSFIVTDRCALPSGASAYYFRSVFHDCKLAHYATPQARSWCSIRYSISCTLICFTQKWSADTAHLLCSIGSDDKCRIILKHTAEAMRRGHSRVLINDWVLPNQGSPLHPATMDINMMAFSLGMERTERQWNALLSSAGFKIVKIWGVGLEVESLIEAVLE